jgi:Tol biopolymer transport system component
MQTSSISAEAILEQLRKILKSSLFRNADRSKALLQFVVEQAVNHQTDRLKEYTLGVEALSRGDTFDPRTDPIVRAEASRLRGRLERYYASEGRTDPIEITLPKGSYIPQFLDRNLSPNLPAATTDQQIIDQKPARPRRFGRGFLIGGSICAAIWGGTVLLKNRLRAVSPQVTQFVISSPPGTVFSAPVARQSFAISPDGTRLAFTASGPDGTRVWIRDMAAVELRPVLGTEGAWSIFWSPDSRSIFFSVQDNLKQTNLETGSTRSVTNVPFTAIHGTWRSTDDVVLYVGARINYEFLVKNGTLHELAPRDMRWAEFLPDGDHFLYVVFDPALGRYRAMVTGFANNKPIPLMETDSRVEYAPPLQRGKPGHLLFLRGSTLLAQAFDADRLALIEQPSPIVQNVISVRATATASFSVSDQGVLVYQAGFPLSELRWYDRTGHVTGTVGNPAPFSGPLRLSPDGQRLAVDIWNPDNSGSRDIWVFGQNGKEKRQLTYPPDQHLRPVWSPDGKRIVFGSSHTSVPKLTVLDAADGSAEQLKEAAQAPPPGDLQIPTDWSHDGRFIVFDTSLGEDKREVWLANATDGNCVPFLHGGFAQWGGAFSPDSRQIAFISTESGRPEAYVQAFESEPALRLVGERRQVSKDGAWLVRWRPDGREIFYVGLDNWLHAVPVLASLQFGQSKSLFQIPGTSQFGTSSDFQFDVGGDGQRFIMTTTGSTPPPDFTVIQNWQDKFHR